MPTPFEQGLIDQAKNQGKPGYDILGNPVAGTPLAGGGAADIGSINVGNLKPATPIIVPPPPVDTTNHNAIVAEGQGTIDQHNTALFPKTDPALQAILDQKPQSFVEAGAAQDTSGRDAAQQAANAQQALVNTAKAKLAGIQAQIQGVIDKRDANNLQLETTASNGQVTGTILNRQQAEVNRQAAIEALPLQALALAAQAEVAGAQGQQQYADSILKQAQDKLDAAFALKEKDITTANATLKDQQDFIRKYLTDAQTKQLDAVQKTQAETFATQQANMNDVHNAANELAKNGQVALATKMYALDPKSSTYMKDFSALVAQGKATTALGVKEAGGIGAGNQITITDSQGKNVTIPVDVAPYYNTATNGVAYADLSSIQGTAAEKKAIVDAAQAAGIKVITNKNTAADLGNIKDANAKLDSISTIMTGIDQPGWISRALYGFGLTKLSVVAQSNPQQAAAGALQSIGLDILKAISGVQGFRGNQTAVQQVTDHLPSIYDTNDVVQTKINFIRTLISDREQGLVGKSAQTGTAPQETTNTAKGQTTIINGHNYVSDGTQWILQQ